MNITGIMVYYYFICERRLWYFANQINMEQNSELVQIGKIIDETTYKREKNNEDKKLRMLQITEVMQHPRVF